VSGRSVGCEVWAAALVVYGDDDESFVGHSVAHGVWETGRDDPSFDDVAGGVVDCGRTGVRPARGRCDRRADGRDEAVSQAMLLLLVPFPCTEDIEFGERVERDGEAHTGWC
jgi:hypothetical protein